MSIQSFLSSLYYDPAGARYGAPVNLAQAGTYFSSSAAAEDGARRAIGSDPRRGVFAPLAYASLIQQAAQPGGVLSDLYTNRVFGSQVGQILAAERNRRSEGARALAQSGANPGIAAQALGQDPYIAQRQIGSLYGGLEADRQQSEFAAMQGLANVLAQAEQQRQSLSFARKDRRDALSQAGIGNVFGGLNAISGLLGGVGILKSTF